ncbi:Membrane associated serine protease, rhomboid family [Streptomyces sp. DvalAA-14]|uniref:rhomboid family intramembrane serine protease n=1 Tax=unclassified Streptomyces TaxID=2593676 RepID=UPI00081B1C37|nr:MULTISPECIES: rhomboid family intramembrane serine protease [unclassified Streptomyces]MYS21200.1 rhomboid family intramembrane serine protease [Streptomyces sp. SID4948]SCD86763.1 Membrane associated serine protease, rhomboid family [Streptomyces sp. DvalAA-14]
MDQQLVSCYRHPDRETGIRCTRCDRPICPQCMVSASVGFQCKECVGQAAGAQVQPRTVAGGSVAADPFLITKILIGLNIAVFLLELAKGNALVNRLDLYAVCGQLPSGQHGCIGVAHGPDQWYRILTSAFAHENAMPPLHIGFNMLSLWWIGAPLERMLGRSRYLALYFVSAVAGSAAVLLLAPSSPTLGASGAIFGLFGATAVFMRRMRYDMRPILILLALNLVFSFTWSGVSWQGHLGGLAGGTLIALALAYAPREHRALVQWGTSAVVLVAALVISAIAVAQVTS